MEKNDFILKVCETQELIDRLGDNDSYMSVEFLEDMMINDGYRISITAWHNNEEYMIDQHITGFYPELMELQIDEVAEGDMFYYGNMSLTDLMATLTNMGFQVQHGGPFEVIDGNETTETNDVDRLERDMYRAVEREDYEEAARIRDIIRDVLRGE